MLNTFLGFLFGFLSAFLSAFLINIWIEGHRNKVKIYNDSKAWFNGIKAEINHLMKVSNSIKDVLKSNLTCTLRLNHDYLENARLRITEFESDINFIESLSDTYREIVHTNGMLDILYKDYEKNQNDKETVGNAFDILRKCISDINGRLNDLRLKVDNKIENLRKPSWSEF